MREREMQDGPAASRPDATFESGERKCLLPLPPGIGQTAEAATGNPSKIG